MTSRAATVTMAAADRNDGGGPTDANWHGEVAPTRPRFYRAAYRNCAPVFMCGVLARPKATMRAGPMAHSDGRTETNGGRKKKEENVQNKQCAYKSRIDQEDLTVWYPRVI